ncbi:Similar to E3 ubiquitin-protein ligase RNF216; acc. no. P58283 [Pyronema omphalodes CBS 100304]|uniref:Similar to E3 ubiquitin-protein ligase RNF216 acc. no. P58283 n=1 Tax=Pyronema omphalodes (strain CBS 100304) TaxID=1076935 RepID=U4LVM8_PYROM|nr:Similar to E3 ubiquitin-protein ligase RNF216; acc. no. P58283 [Pyronema omphalodes CBS 100304]
MLGNLLYRSPRPASSTTTGDNQQRVRSASTSASGSASRTSQTSQATSTAATASTPQRDRAATTTTHTTTPTTAATASSIAESAKVAFLNQSLETLLEVFPGGDVEEVRRLLQTSGEESRIYVVTEMLLKSGGRVGKDAETRELEDWEKFRTEEYKEAVRRVLSKEFRGLSKSTILAVMAEHNFQYSRARTTLLEIASKSWRFSLSNFFRRSKPIPAVPLTTTPTGSAELDAELHDLLRPTRDQQINDDRLIALRLNEAEAASASALQECQCCYGDYSWEETACCSEGHFFCHGCLTRSVQETIFGQGKSLLLTEGSSNIGCISSSASCSANVPMDILQAALPADLLKSLENRTASETLEKSGLKLIRCPFCDYAEADETQPYRIRYNAVAIGLFSPFVAVSALSIILPGFSTIWRVCLAMFILSMTPLLSARSLPTRIAAAFTTVSLRHRGALFRCLSPACSRGSCLLCSKEFTPFHRCYEREEDAARLYIEKAMADAVKRTCPQCSVSFVKSDGCNKLTCPCGQVPGRACEECRECDLYVAEDEEGKIKEARETAEREYWDKHKKPKNWGKGTTGMIGPEGLGRGREISAEGAQEKLDKVLDWGLEMAVERCVEFL